MEGKVFTKENCEDLKRLCTQISSLMDENIDGELMMSQKMILAEKIEDFVNNPIVTTSGVQGLI